MSPAERVEDALRDLLDCLDGLPPGQRLSEALDARDLLCDLTDEVRDAVTRATLDLRVRGLSYPQIVRLSGRDVTYQAAERWAHRRRAA